MDYSNLKYDLSLVKPGECVIDAFPELGLYEEFENRKCDDILRWVILLVDDGSPFFKLYKSDFKEKALAVYKHLKLTDENLRLYIDDQYIGNENRIVIERAIFKYFILLDKENYNTWFSKWCFVQELNAFLRIQIDPNDNRYEQKVSTKQKTSITLAAEQQQLSAYEKQVFGDSKIKNIAVKEAAKVTNWPEKLALEYRYKG